MAKKRPAPKPRKAPLDPDGRAMQTLARRYAEAIAEERRLMKLARAVRKTADALEPELIDALRIPLQITVGGFRVRYDDSQRKRPNWAIEFARVAGANEVNRIANAQPVSVRLVVEQFDA